MKPPFLVDFQLPRLIAGGDFIRMTMNQAVSGNRIGLFFIAQVFKTSCIPILFADQSPTSGSKIWTPVDFLRMYLPPGLLDKCMVFSLSFQCSNPMF